MCCCDIQADGDSKAENDRTFVGGRSDGAILARFIKRTG